MCKKLVIRTMSLMIAHWSWCDVFTLSGIFTFVGGTAIETNKIITSSTIDVSAVCVLARANNIDERVIPLLMKS